MRCGLGDKNDVRMKREFQEWYTESSLRLCDEHHESLE
jgi:hypothetical protein